MSLPTQTSKNVRKGAVNRSFSSMDSVKKLGLDKFSAHERAEMMKNFYNRRIILQVPPDIEAANPDKKFFFVNMNKWEKNGHWSPQGYRLYKTGSDSENQASEKFNASSDGLVHRNEMVLAYLPKEEWEMREMERAVVRATKNATDVFLNNDSLKGFSPTAVETVETVRY